jgi:hypothetical protein
MRMGVSTPWQNLITIRTGCFVRVDYLDYECCVPPPSKMSRQKSRGAFAIAVPPGAEVEGDWMAWRLSLKLVKLGIGARPWRAWRCPFPIPLTSGHGEQNAGGACGGCCADLLPLGGAKDGAGGWMGRGRVRGPAASGFPLPARVRGFRRPLGFPSDEPPDVKVTRWGLPYNECVDPPAPDF